MLVLFYSKRLRWVRFFFRNEQESSAKLSEVERANTGEPGNFANSSAVLVVEEVVVVALAAEIHKGETFAVHCAVVPAARRGLSTRGARLHAVQARRRYTRTARVSTPVSPPAPRTPRAHPGHTLRPIHSHPTHTRAHPAPSQGTR